MENYRSSKIGISEIYNQAKLKKRTRNRQMAYLTHLSSSACMTDKCSKQASLEQRRKANLRPNDERDIEKTGEENGHSGAEADEQGQNRGFQERTNEKRTLVACLESLGK